MSSYRAIAVFFLIGAVFFLMVGSMLEYNLFWTGMIGLTLLGAIVLFKARS